MENDTKIRKIPKDWKSFFPWAKHFLFSSKKRTIISVVVIILVIFLGWKVIGSSAKTPQYQTTQVTKGTIISTVSESGNVASASMASVGSPTNGLVTDIYVKDGDQVSVGDNLFKVKSTANAQEIASAYANYLSAQNNLDTAKSKMNSLQSALFKANQAFVTDRGVQNPTDQQKADPVYIEEQANWLQAESDYNNQAVAISQAQAALNNAWLSYEATQDSVVTAPIAGTVANIAVQAGDQIAASSGNLSSELSGSSNSSSNNPVLTIGNFSNPYIKIAASEVDIPNIHAGQKATITMNAFPDKTFVGNVSQVDTVGTISSGVVTYSVFITFVAAPPSIQPGMSATVSIETARKDDVLTVPSSAVQNLNGSTSIRVMQNGQVTSVPVTTGISSDTDTEIVSGLSEGQTVVTSIVLPTSGSTGSTTSPFSGLGGGRGGFGGGGGGAVFFRSGGGGGGGTGRGG